MAGLDGVGHVPPVSEAPQQRSCVDLAPSEGWGFAWSEAGAWAAKGPWPRVQALRKWD